MKKKILALLLAATLLLSMLALVSCDKGPSDRKSTRLNSSHP